MQRVNAFTLIELLVVIAIIAVLAGISLPVFSRVQEKAKATSDASNLRQLGIGITAFLNENDDILFSENSDADSAMWPETLHEGYVSDWKAFVSPFNPNSVKDPDSAENARVDYGLSQNLIAQDLSFVDSLSQAVLAAPAYNYTQNPDIASAWPASNKGNVEVKVSPSGNSSKVFGTHSGNSRINALFADSHVEPIPMKEFCDKNSDAGQERWPTLD